MKKRVLSFIAMLSIFQINAQTLFDLTKENTPQIIPPSPQSWVFEKYINHSINEYSGVPDIQIPLHEIEIKGIKIPVTLTYDASGIKYKQHDGEIGAGWNLNIGGYRVFRTIYGKPDEKVPFYSPTLLNSVKNNDRQRDVYLAHMNLEYHEIANTVNVYPNQSWVCDGQYDQFSYYLPTTRGHFIITDRNARTVDIMEQNQDKIYINLGNTPFHNMRITDPDGNNYFFSTSGQVEKTIVNGQSEETGWLMNKMVSTLNDSVCFSYKKIPLYSIMGNLNMTLIDIPQNIPQFDNENNYQPEITFNNGVPDLGITGIYDDAYYIDEITTDKEIIKIHRSEPYGFRHIIERITVTNRYTGQILKTITFLNHQTRYPHVLLDGIETVGSDASSLPQKYQFRYYEWAFNGNQHFDKNTYSDQWGYYNYCGDTYHSSVPVLHSEFGSINYTRQIGQQYPISSIQPPFWLPRTQNNAQENYFSLKRITYPTGGYSEYEYEPNRSGQGQGLGWRVKKITSTAGANEKKISTIFKYGYNENGIGTVNFAGTGDFLNFFISQKIYFMPHYYTHYFLSPDNPYLSSNPSISQTAIFDGIMHTAIRCFSESPTMAAVSSSKVYYTHVAKYEYDETENKYNGKTLSVYDVPISYYYKTYLQKPSIFNNYSGGNITHWGDLEISRYYPGIHPVITERTIYDANGNKQQRNLFEYMTKHEIYEGLKSRQFVSYDERVALAPIGSTPEVYSYTDFLFSHMEYYIESCPKFPSYQQNIHYTYQNNVLKDSIIYEQSSVYNSQNQLITVSQGNSTGGSLVKSYKYPQDFASGNNIYVEMVTKNMVAPVIEQVSTHNNTEIGRIKTDYFKDIQKTNGFILPEKVRTSASGVANFRTDITYDLYDSKGNIRQYTSLDEVNTVYLWGYKGQYPIAEIKNATYESVQNAVSSVFSMTVETLSAQNIPNETALTNRSLQNALPGAIVTTYTYKPLVGLWKMQDPRGIVTEYVYDNFGRLKQVLVDGKKEQEYKYHYKE